MKANKKKFTDGLDILFSDPTENQLPKDSALLSEREQAYPLSGKNEVATQPIKKTAHKNFTSDLDALFNNALQESISEMQTQQYSSQAGSRFAANQRMSAVPTGLDAIIRQTLHSSQSVSVKDVANTIDSPAGRIVFTFDKKKLDKLKDIARAEQTFVKDIIKRVIAEYIQSYEQQNGAAI